MRVTRREGVGTAHPGAVYPPHSRVWVCGPTKDGAVTGAGVVLGVLPGDDDGGPDHPAYLVAVGGRRLVFAGEYLTPFRG